ncbi:hypothetical protein RHSIM_Rhsim09G0125400 [Rhododendron simsii]|uniref:Uncharacterized protein n=1 Tax=Rhododendron simsii TaxID=118357 RepID=A0A834GC62_RHOSS|nr:hypothetical protein RHSIM_Rhsim09G0125400 [Rhododendron simsii]
MGSSSACAEPLFGEKLVALQRACDVTFILITSDCTLSEFSFNLSSGFFSSSTDFARTGELLEYDILVAGTGKLVVEFGAGKLERLFWGA